MPRGPQEFHVSDAFSWPADLSPEPQLIPASVAELADIVRRAAEAGTALFPLGGQTQMDLGLWPDRSGRGVDLRRLDQVIDYPARDMTITVQSGVTIARLQQLLAAENQRLPIDVPLPERATLGGSLAANISGPRRLGFGTFRDYLLGVSFVNDQGHEVKAGGRVVKNVAGYDICKLMIGSLGTLGILTQVTLKVKPRPEEQALVAFGCDNDKLEFVLDALHTSRIRPVCIELLNADAVTAVNRRMRDLLPGVPWVVVVGFEDNRDAVPWQAQQLIKESGTKLERGLDVRVGQAAGVLWKALIDLPSTAGDGLSFKANVLPRAVAGFCRLANEQADVMRIHAHAGSGIVMGHADESLTLERAKAMLNVLLDAATKAGGNMILSRCPPDWKRLLPVWGRPRADLWLMRRIKDKFDPKRIFNPGRFVDGI
jgi:glycolate oxidase FAD binding subunit